MHQIAWRESEEDVGPLAGRCPESPKPGTKTIDASVAIDKLHTRLPLLASATAPAPRQ